MSSNPRKDHWFLRICEALASESKCMSRKVGALIVLDGAIVSTGYNGPPRGIPHCDEGTGHTVCPRRLLGYESGQGMDLCPAAHAETNAIANAARLGVSCLDTTLYLNCVIPCKNCTASIINAGIKEVVCLELEPYDILGYKMLTKAGVFVRKFSRSV